MPNNENYIAQITLPNNTTYQLKDAFAREQIAAITGTVSGVMKWIGVTTTPLTDGATTNPITVNGSNYTAIAGDVVAYGDLEFAWSALGHWCEFGSTGSLKALAFADTATGSITPSGTVSQPTFSGNQLTSTGNFTPNGGVTIQSGAVGNGKTANYTPAGNISADFSGTSGSVSVTGSLPQATATIPVAVSTTSVGSMSGQGTQASFSATVNSETLTLSFTPNNLPTMESVTIVSGISTPSPNYSGTPTNLNGTVSYDSDTVTSTGNFTPQGNITNTSFQGTGTVLSATFIGEQGNVSVTGTPSGTVTQPEFTGTATTVTVYPPSQP